MLVTITKDYYDGTQSKSKTFELEDVQASDLVWMMMEGAVASITITKETNILKAIKKMEG